MWFGLVCALIDTDTHHHSGQNLLWTDSAVLPESTTFGYCDDTSLSMGVQTTLNHIQFVKFKLVKSFINIDEQTSS